MILFTESSGKGKQHWTNFKIILNFPVYEGEAYSSILKTKSRYVEVSGATALISVVFNVNYPFCPSLCSGEI